MRLALLAVSCLTLVGCNPQGIVADTVPELIRSGTHTFGDERVRGDIELFATSPEVSRILHQLTRDLIETAAGSARGPEVEASLRALIHAAIDEVRSSTADVPPALDAALDDLLRDAEAMVGRVVTSALRQVRAMGHGDEVSAWVRALVHDVLTDLWALASGALDQENAEQLGRFMHTVFRELVADVELEDGTRRMARAAAQGFGQGLADSLHGELGDALHEERSELLQDLRESSADAARPWMFVSGGGVVAALMLAALWWRSHRAHQTTLVAQKAILQELQRGAKRGAGAGEVVRAARDRGVKVEVDLDENPNPSE